ncbi:hypothetical protein [Anaerocolumna xylanovorans]|uniref:Lipoprotein n=1 Tax=Anaerocolumna xylanovorans DSM 12503 TaxID=1121345 RepID=A0A1M7Y7T9_9FIRM|nr:hypothetical protein [Anaerocolumna xylanovorans]SHO48598.1 hypothetical protein SAMN02745217_01919 [Anaerocolumna xylanovorans DSM 12503]
MKQKIKCKTGKKAGYLLCFMITILFSLTLTGCADQGDNYLKSQKSYLDYTFQSKDWRYTSEMQSSNNALGGTSKYVVNTIYFTDSNGDEDTFELNTRYSGYTYTMAANVYNKMTEIMAEDISDSIEEYSDLNEVYILTDYESLSNTERKQNNYNDSDEWAKWLVNNKKGVKLYNIYEFIEKNLKLKKDRGGYIILKIVLNNTEDKDLYEHLKNSINSIYKDYSKNIGFNPNMKIIVDSDDMSTLSYFKSGILLKCDSDEEYYEYFK